MKILIEVSGELRRTLPASKRLMFYHNVLEGGGCVVHLGVREKEQEGACYETRLGEFDIPDDGAPCATPCAFGPGSSTGHCPKKDCRWRTTGEGCPRPKVHTRADGTKVI